MGRTCGSSYLTAPTLTRIGDESLLRAVESFSENEPPETRRPAEGRAGVPGKRGMIESGNPILPNIVIRVKPSR
jgi:hypothetical protein